MRVFNSTSCPEKGAKAQRFPMECNGGMINFKDCFAWPSMGNTGGVQSWNVRRITSNYSAGNISNGSGLGAIRWYANRRIGILFRFHSLVNIGDTMQLVWHAQATRARQYRVFHPRAKQGRDPQSIRHFSGWIYEEKWRGKWDRNCFPWKFIYHRVLVGSKKLGRANKLSPTISKQNKIVTW